MDSAATRSDSNRGYRREFLLTPGDFETLRHLLKEQTGINLSPAKEDMVYARLSRRLRARGLTRFRDYLEQVRGDEGERLNLINALTTNLTAFFREPHHFEHLRQVVIPDLAARRDRPRRLRLWSAGCASGEEPYSLAMTLLEALEAMPGWDLKILASDLDTSMVETAARGEYGEERVQGLDPARRRRWLQRGTGPHAGRVRVRPQLKELIRFEQLNLMDPWPMRRPLDVIFCRNVVIYFDKPTQRRLFDRYANQLADGGWLYIGHSESLHGVSDRFRPMGKTIYQKVR